jgi:hypothetical protein
MQTIQLTEKQIGSFWSFVKKLGPNHCWEWTTSKFHDGYGNFRNLRAHRIAYTLLNGPIPEGLHCLHKCDNRKCCNPDHLFLGTNDDNMRDKCQKNRQSKGKKHSDSIIPQTPRGEKAPSAKLTEQQVLEIRSKYKKWTYGSKRLASEYGVRFQTILGIVNRKYWTHI